jgi:hypothetical protein
VAAVLPTGAPLVGRTVRLDPLTEADLPALFPLLADPEIYAAGYVMHRRPGSVEDAVALALERFLPAGVPDGRGGGGRLPYAVRLVADGTLVGTSSLLEAHLVNENRPPRLDAVRPSLVGRPRQPRGQAASRPRPGARPERAKGGEDGVLSLLNTRSQEAIARLGARREGVLRRERRREDGTFRDTVVFSVQVDEWPAVKAGLLARLEG